MYIALRWLLTLNFLLWLALSMTNIVLVNNEDATDFHFVANDITEDSRFLWWIDEINVFTIITFTLQIILCGIIILVILCKKHNWLFWLSYLTPELIYGYIMSFLTYLYYKYAKTYSKNNYIQFKPWQSIKGPKGNSYSVFNVTLLLLFIIKHLTEERKKFTKSMSGSDQEYSCLEIHYKLDSMAKYKEPNAKEIQWPAAMVQSYDSSYKQSYRTLYFENLFLRSSLEKLAKEKKIIEKNLLNIITQVFFTNNNGLKAYCSKFVVQTQQDMFKADMKLEVQKFLTNLDKTNDNQVISFAGLQSNCKDIKNQNEDIVKLNEPNNDLGTDNAVSTIKKHFLHCNMDQLVEKHRIFSESECVGDPEERESMLPIGPTLTSLLIFQGFLRNCPVLELKMA